MSTRHGQYAADSPNRASRLGSRNQVEGAIARATGRTHGADYRPEQELITRFKRLAETDRATRVDGRASSPLFHRYAFFDEAPPGKGAEIWYSSYAAFALYLGFRLMDAGFPQSAAVAFLRRIRPDLEKENARILRLKPKALIDHSPAKDLDSETARGMLVRKIVNMAFLVVPAGDPAGVFFDKSQDGGRPSANICRGPKRLAEVMQDLAAPGGVPLITMELVNPAHQLQHWLDRIPPVSRGRKQPSASERRGAPARGSPASA